MAQNNLPLPQPIPPRTADRELALAVLRYQVHAFDTIFNASFIAPLTQRLDAALADAAKKEASC